MPSPRDAGESPKINLAAEMLRRCGTLKLKAWGVSMLPCLWPGDVLTVQNVPVDEIVPGDMVLVLRNNRFFVHRLVEKQGVKDSVVWVTRGDAMPINDPPAAAFEVLGRVTEVLRGNNSFVPSPRVTLFSSMLGWVLCRADGVRNLILSTRKTQAKSGPLPSAYTERGSSELPASCITHP